MNTLLIYKKKKGKVRFKNMSTTPETPMDYLKVPTNRRLVHSTPRRNASFVLKSNQSDERIASNLSLSSAGHSILKQPNASLQHPTTSSRLSVHYSAVKNEDEDKSSTLIENNQVEPTQTQNHHSLKMPEHYGLPKLIKESRWSNPFGEGRYEKRFISIAFFFHDYLFNQIESDNRFMHIVYIKYKLDISFECLKRNTYI